MAKFEKKILIKSEYSNKIVIKAFAKLNKAI